MRTAGSALLVLVALASCSSYAMWPRTDEFLSRLCCRMSEAQVSSIVEEFPGLRFGDSGRGTPWTKVAQIAHRDGTTRTTIYLNFDDTGLSQAQVIWIDGILSAEALPIHEFCARVE